MDNVGFFNSKVSHTVEYKKRSVNLIYAIEPAQPYLISEISYDVSDTLLNGFFKKNIEKTLIKKGDIYNAYTCDDERDRISTHLRNEGYYFFNRNFIQFIVDSAFADHSMTVVLKINNVKENVKGVPGQYTEKNHRRYYIKNVNVIPDFKPAETVAYDTVPHQIEFWNDETDNTYYFLLDEKKRIKPKAFNSTIKIKPEHAYSAADVQKTYRGLFNFRIIRTANITFDTVGAGDSEDGSYSYMNSRIQMQTAKLNSFQAEVEGTNSSGDLGIRGSVVLANKNIFKQADVFSIRLNGGFEAQSFTPTPEDPDNSLFNTFEAGVSGNFYFPRFLFPGKLIKFNQKYSPITNVNFGYSYQIRREYYRYITNLDFGYHWNQTQQIRHLVPPININYVSITLEDDFEEKLKEENNPRLTEQYSDHLIAGLSYSFIYNNQNLKTLEHFNYFRTNIETSGNLLYGMNKSFSPNKVGVTDTTAGYYTVGDVRYSQYFRVNFDYRHYYYFFEKSNSLVFRLLLGIGIPYLNSNELPYEKAFFAGGANDMRGWRFRTLGPGGSSGNVEFESAGDMQIEGNAEYRFTIYSVLKGALFVDVGNIWLLPKYDTLATEDQLAGEFNWNTWYQQLAVDIGIGLRLDFSFFIFRLDMAVPIVDPKYWAVEGESQIRFPIEWDTRTVFNFGIGYPF